MKLLPFLLPLLSRTKADEVLAENNPEHDKQAADICKRFYDSRLDQDDTESVSVLNRGTICVIYKCETSVAEHEPNQVVIRVDTNPVLNNNETEIALVNLQLSEQGARNKVYKWTETEKIEELLVDMVDSPDLSNREVQAAVARQLAKMHSAEIDGIDKNRYREATDQGFWNTYNIKYHFGQIHRFMEFGIFPGTPDQVYSGMGLTKDELDSEIDFVEGIVHAYLAHKPETPVVSHNDCRERNIMFNSKGDFDPESLTFVDFDLTAYGFRTWDVLYHMTKWLTPPSREETDRFVLAYCDALTNNLIEYEDMHEMLDAFRPYVLLEQWMFVYVSSTNVKTSSLHCKLLIQAYDHPQYDNQFRQQYEAAISKFDRKLKRYDANRFH